MSGDAAVKTVAPDPVLGVETYPSQPTLGSTDNEYAANADEEEGAMHMSESSSPSLGGGCIVGDVAPAVATI